MPASVSRRSSFVIWLLLVVVGIALAWVTGRLQPHFVSDSASYLDYSFGTVDEIARSIRTPGYPAWLVVLRATLGIAMVPAAQVVVHATAVWMFLGALIRLKLPLAQSLAAALAVAVGCTPMDHINTISTDAITASVGVMVAAALLRATALQTSTIYTLLIAALATLAIFLRPAYIFLIPWLFVAGCLLQIMRGTRWPAAIKRGLTLSLLTAVPVIAWMLLRWVVVGEFAVLPFGHQNLAAILVQLVSEDELRDLDGEASDLAGAIVDEKNSFESSGRGFADGAVGATMTIDARWDDMTYYVVVPASAKIAGDDAVARHRAVRTFNRAILSRWPARYAVWLAKAARRGAWAIAADIVMHPVFLAAFLWALLLVVYRATTGMVTITQPPASLGIRALAIVAITYMFAKLAFVILSSPPIGRFSDAAAILMPAWLAALIVRWYCGQPSSSEKGSGLKSAKHPSGHPGF